MRRACVVACHGLGVRTWSLSVLALGALATLALPRPAAAQAPGVAYTRGAREPAPFVFRLADASRRWIALERDRDLTSQEILVLDARDGTEVLRAPGLTRPPDGWHPVSETYDLAVSPFLSGDRVLTFVDPDTLVAAALPGGAELWRARVPVRALVTGTFVVTERRLAWADGTELHVLDAATGRELWTATFRPWSTHGLVAIAADDRVATWDAEGAVIVWDATGRETMRLTRAIDWGAAGLFFTASALVTVGSSVTWIDASTGRELEVHPCAEQSAAADAGTHLIVADENGLWARPEGGGAAVRLAPASSRGWLHDASGGVLVVGDDGVATLYDLAGAVRARFSVGVPIVRWMYRPRSRVGVARGALGGEDVIVRVDPSGALEARSLAVPSPPPRRVVVTGVLRVSGRARAGVPLTIGGVRARTSADGRFRARVEVEGPVLLRVTGDDLVRASHRPCAHDHEELVEIPEAGTAPIRLRVETHAYPYECDAACRCD